jgi:hypothetical protein
MRPRLMGKMNKVLLLPAYLAHGKPGSLKDDGSSGSSSCPEEVVWPVVLSLDSENLSDGVGMRRFEDKTSHPAAKCSPSFKCQLHVPSS